MFRICSSNTAYRSRVPDLGAVIQCEQRWNTPGINQVQSAFKSSGNDSERAMPIRSENRWFYPIDWPQLSNAIRFGRARSRCERCKRPHMRKVLHLGDGRWWDALAHRWRNDHGRVIKVGGALLQEVRSTYVVLACAHLNHNPTDNDPANLAALCQRCHMRHDAKEHRWQRWWNAFRHRGVRDLFCDPQTLRLEYLERCQA
ncbi:hypothetical protein NOVOSPHI9U_370031 [Novosphingobium sp. 9U]|nr:hypothetical protein NOVOSPHI9U_370031 [Novosphingobium sp. 9U]